MTQTLLLLKLTYTIVDQHRLWVQKISRETDVDIHYTKRRQHTHKRDKRRHYRYVRWNAKRSSRSAHGFYVVTNSLREFSVEHGVGQRWCVRAAVSLHVLHKTIALHNSRSCGQTDLCVSLLCASTDRRRKSYRIPQHGGTIDVSESVLPSPSGIDVLPLKLPQSASVRP